MSDLMPVRDPLADPKALTRRVYSYVAYRLGDGSDAEDVTSEVFERAIRYRRNYDRTKGEPIAWLLGIARRCVDTALTQQTETTDVTDYAADGDLEHEILERLTLTAAVGQLDARGRELIALRYGADLTAPQIADVLEMRTNAVEVALHRALNRLRSILDGGSGDSGRVRDAVRIRPLTPVSDVKGARATGESA